MTLNNNILVDVKNLKKFFPLGGVLFEKKKKKVHAVNSINFKIYKGETLGLIGESGCGKTTTGRLILRLIEATEGEIYFDGVNVRKLQPRELIVKRKDMQIIFQDPYNSLNPRKTVRKIIEEPLIIHKVGDSKFRSNRVLELLNIVRLNPECINRYPHEFSGGQRQRIGIARALALNPKFIVCDEPVSALDVSIQAQILNLLKNLQNEFNLTYLFIAHNFSVVKHISDRIAVMYLGNIVEVAKSEEIYKNPLHPYTKALLSAIMIPDPIKNKCRKRIILDGDVPSSIEMPKGCCFNLRCVYAEKICLEKEPKLINYNKYNKHLVSCHFI